MDESTGKRHPVSDMDCTEGFVTVPKPFNAVFRPRGQYVRNILPKGGTTHDVNHTEILNEAGKERMKRKDDRTAAA